MHKQKSLFMICQPKLPVDSYLRQTYPLSSVSVSLIYDKTGIGKVQLVLQNFELKSDVAGFTTNESTCLVTNQIAVGCVMLLQKAERLSSFCNNFLHLQEPELLHDRLVKRPTSLFNSFCSNFAKQGARCCCPFSTKLYG